MHRFLHIYASAALAVYAPPVMDFPFPLTNSFLGAYTEQAELALPRRSI